MDRSASEVNRPSTFQPETDQSMGIWRNVLEQAYGLQFECHPDRGFDATVSAKNVGDIKIAEVRLSGQTLQPRCRMDMPEEQLLVKLVVDGVPMFEQNGERRRFAQGSIIVLDPAQPFVEVILDDVTMVVVACPKSELKHRGYPSSLSHWVIPNIESADVKMLSEMIQLVARYRDSIAQSTRVRLSSQLLDMMDIAVRTGTEPRFAGGTEAARYRVKRYIAQHLCEEGLDAKAIAGGVSLSLSYLSRIFREEDTSLMAYLWSQRLERAYDLLASSAHDGLRMEEVAWRCGFASAAHFSRLFRGRYVCSPKEFRRNRG